MTKQAQEDSSIDEIIHIKSSKQLYNLISRRNLDLQSGYGRDDALLRGLARRLRLNPDKPISRQLESRKISLEEFVQAFFLLTEPFAKMLSAIYSIMQCHQARSALRSIRMRFSFQEIREELDFDLEHFREWLAIYQGIRGTFTIRLWFYDDICKLFQPIGTLRNIYGDHDWRKGYSSPLPEPQILYTNCQWAPLGELRDEMEQLRKIASVETDERAKALSVLTKEYGEKVEHIIEFDPSKVQSMLSDLWPGFFGLLSHLEKSLPREPLPREAINALQGIREIIRDVHRTRMDREVLMRDLVELLRLPFWKHCWRVYEVWVMFEIIDCLDKYDITLELVGDRLALEEYKATKVAQFKDLKGDGFEVWTQLSTPVDTPYKKKHIMPDIRFCRPDASLSENTFLLVECKQRTRMNSKDIEDLVEDYGRGAHKSALNLFVNYNRFPAIPAYRHVKLFSNFNPSCPSTIQEFKNLIKSTLVRCGIEPVTPQFDAILFDVSESMRGKYTDLQIRKACKELLMKNPRSKIFFFSSNLLATEKLSTQDLESELQGMISGSTNLNGALLELHEKYPGVKHIAVVTDGQYDGPIDSCDLFQIPEELILEKNFSIRKQKMLSTVSG